jgi:hypothetical protein
MISLEQLQDNWAILTGFVMGVLAWGRTANAVKSHGETIAQLDKRVAKIEGVVSTIRESAASIAASAEATRETVELLLRSRIG